jgi:hypothetical protein
LPRPPPPPRSAPRCSTASPPAPTTIEINSPSSKPQCRFGRPRWRRRRGEGGGRRGGAGGIAANAADDVGDFGGRERKKNGVVDLVEGTGELFCCCGLKPTKHCMGQVEVTASPDSWEKLGPPGPGPCSKEYE